VATTEETFEPAAEHVISDVETLKALSDPVRLRILETMVSRPHESWTVKRLAEALGTGPTKLYHHVGILEERGLIRIAGTRVVSGIIETRYRIAQLSLRLDRGLLSAGIPETVDDLMRTVLDGVRDGIVESLAAGVADNAPDAPPHRRLLLSRGLARVRRERAAELHERMRALLAELDEIHDDPDGEPFGYLVGLYPMTERQTTDDQAGSE
jgi:DNA-binding transcriptional ArsR family regulator